MGEGQNMVCPGCGAFQPRAEVCIKCGVVIAKKAGPSQKPKPMAGPIPMMKAKPQAGPATKPADSKPPLALILAAVIVVFGICYLVFFPPGKSVAGKTEEKKTTPAKTEIERIATVKPGVANELQRSQVQSKLHTLRTQLNLYLTEHEQPPSNEEGLQSLVAKGVLTEAVITDEWGHAYNYRLEWGQETATEKKFKISVTSNGPDGIAGNEDDIGL